jgi:hypothetical protein
MGILGSIKKGVSEKVHEVQKERAEERAIYKKEHRIARREAIKVRAREEGQHEVFKPGLLRRGISHTGRVEKSHIESAFSRAGSRVLKPSSERPIRRVSFGGRHRGRASRQRVVYAKERPRYEQPRNYDRRPIERVPEQNRDPFGFGAMFGPPPQRPIERMPTRHPSNDPFGFGMLGIKQPSKKRRGLF